MSYHDAWCTKADILDDLAQVTGGITDVDEAFIVRGEKPPPPRCCNEEDEINLRFGHEALNQDGDVVSVPDLRGITEMLRMVAEHDETEDTVSGPTSESSDSIVISKLNPDVPEFVPQGTLSSPSNKENDLVNKKNDLVNKKNDLVNKKNDVVYKQNSLTQNDCSAVRTTIKKRNFKSNNANKSDITTEKIDLSRLNGDELKNVTMKLRSKISEANKQDNPLLKREKNVAIATLLKLYSQTPREAKSAKIEISETDDEKPIKLCTPEYFETFPTHDDSNSHVSSSPSVVVKEASESTNQKDESIRNHIKKAKLVDTGMCNGTTEESEQINEPSKPKFEVSASNNNKYLAHDVQESINKVNKWFEKPKSPKPKAPAICLGPISFQRKASSTVKTPTSEVDSMRSTPPNSTPQIGQYKPSKLADDLRKKFMEQGKALERRNEDVWTRVQNEMKEKEEKMKEKNSNGSLNDGIDN